MLFSTTQLNNNNVQMLLYPIDRKYYEIGKMHYPIYKKVLNIN